MKILLIILCSANFVLVIISHAGPLANNLRKVIKSTPNIHPVRPDLMSPSGLKIWSEAQKLDSMASGVFRSPSGETALYIVNKRNLTGDTSAIFSGYKTESGGVNTLKMQISDARLFPKDTKVIGDIDSVLKVSRTTETAKGDSIIHQSMSYYGERTSNKNSGFRLLHDMEKVKGDESVKIINRSTRPSSDFPKLDLEIKTGKGDNAKIQTYELELIQSRGPDEKVMIIDFNLDTSGTKLNYTVLSTNDEGVESVTEYTANIVFNEGKAIVDYRGREVLTKSDIVKKRLRAEFEVHAPKSARPPRVRPQKSSGSSGATN
ncbi:MAG: hypothetical protein H6625_13400 [Bdellovibrionaceae bacterium]|nr:hypothetical protein [Pseudobdellovibrionaceae bacterium]